MQQADVWAVTPASDDDLFRADASIGGAGALTLLTRTVGPNGSGYKIVITSAGDDRGITFTVVGYKVGDMIGQATTEVLTGANASTVTSTNYYASIVSITASGASAGNVKIGTTGSLALPRCRVKGLHYVVGTSAGSIKVNSNSPTGTLLLQLDTPAVASSALAISVTVPMDGILTARSSSSDFAVVTLTNVTYVTLFCG